MCLPPSIAPFEVVVTPVNMKGEAQRAVAQKIYDELKASGVDALIDDRDERPGVKFKDADLIGIPYRITVGKKAAEGIVEAVTRRGQVKQEIPIDRAVEWVLDQLRD